MCSCRDRVNDELAEFNAQIAFGFSFSNSSMDISPPIIETEKVNKSLRRTKVPVVLAAFCPWCGESYKKEEVSG